jgi:hypothetical protein
VAKLNVVLGATLPMGVLLTRRLAAEGRVVRALVLNADRARGLFPRSVSVAEIDPTRTSIQDGCEGAQVIYNLFEPVNIKQQGTAAEAASAVLLAAIHSRAKVVIASHLFHAANDNRAMENDALETHRSNFARVVVARFPQIYGPDVKSVLINNVFEEALTGNKAHWMGRLDRPRSLLFIEDAVNAIQLLERTDSAFGSAWNISGPSPMTGKDFIELAFRAAGRAGTASVWGRGIMMTGRILDSKAAGFLDLPYDYYSPFVIDGGRFAEAFPSFEYTPNETGVRKSLEWYRDQVRQRLARPAS